MICKLFSLTKLVWSKKINKKHSTTTTKKTKAWIFYVIILLLTAGLFLFPTTKTVAQSTQNKNKILTPTILQPKKEITTAKPIIAGVSLNNTQIEIYIDQKLKIKTKTKNHPSGVGSFNWQVQKPLKTGRHTIQVKAIDLETKNQSSLSESKTFTIIPFGGPSLILPAKVKLTKPFTYVQGVAHNNSTINVYVDNQLRESFALGSDPSNAVGFKKTLKKPLFSGKHSLYLIAQDKTGRKSIASPVKQIEIVDFPAPTILQPKNHSKTTNANPVIAGIAFNKSIVHVYVNGSLDGQANFTNGANGIGNFTYQLQSKLNRNQQNIITAKAIGPNGRISPISKPVNIFVQEYYIPPTLLKVKNNQTKPIITGVAHNNSLIKIFVNGKLDSVITPANHPSGTLYFKTQLKNSLSAGKHIITAQAFNDQGKPSTLSNALVYNYYLPATNLGQADKKTKEKITDETDEKESEKTTDSKETDLDDSTKIKIEDQAKEDKIEIKDQQQTGTITTQDEKTGRVEVQQNQTKEQTQKEETSILEQNYLESTTNWPLVIGVFILIALAIIFISWYLSQKRKLLNEGIEKLFSDEEEEPDLNLESTFKSKKTETKNKKKSSHLDDIPPPPPAI